MTQIRGNAKTPTAETPVTALRMLRASLRNEERRVSYWRRLVQGRIDLISAGNRGRSASLASLAGLAGPGAAQVAPWPPERAVAVPKPGLLDKLDGDPLRDAERLWQQPVPWDDEEALTVLASRLRRLEADLSAYRRLLHQRIDACTEELISRYRRDLEEVPGLAVLTGPDGDEATVEPAF